MKKRIILASTSPRRHGLLQQIGLEFEVIPSKYEEDMTLDLPPHKLAMTLAHGKAKEVAGRVRTGIVIGADTFVALKGKLLGKPKDKKDAKRMLRFISGKEMEVYSGITIIDAKTKKELRDYKISLIRIRRLTDQMIDKYIATGEPMDKAGAIATQGLGAVFVSKVDGCYANVIGLPLYLLTDKLKKFDVDIFAYDKWNNS